MESKEACINFYCDYHQFHYMWWVDWHRNMVWFFLSCRVHVKIRKEHVEQWNGPENVPTGIKTRDGRRNRILGYDATVHRAHGWLPFSAIFRFLHLNDESFFRHEISISLYTTSIDANAMQGKNKRTKGWPPRNGHK